MLRRFVHSLALALALGAVLSTDALAQGITTGAIGGLVSDAEGGPVAGAQVMVANRGTGYSISATTRENGRYHVPGLDVGTYSVTVRRIGFEPQTREDVRVSIGQVTPADFRLTAQAVQITGVEVVATSDFSATRTGVMTSVSDTTISRLPTLNRDLTELVKLSPHVVLQNDGGPSAVGGYNRLNNFTIDGANQNDRFGLGSSEGVPGGATNGRLISIDAVKEFQVLLSPADVRHGNFAGMLVNAVTKNGTNELEGGAIYAFRSPDLAASENFIQQSNFKVQQFGFHLGGPIIRDKLHFFVAPEWQARTQPAVGPYEGQTPPENGNLAPALIDRLEAAVNPYFPIGTTGLVQNDNPLMNLSGRLDWQLNERHRLVFRQLYNTAEQDEFSRNSRTFSDQVGSQNQGFRFGSNGFVRENTNSSTALQAYSYVGAAGLNEFLIGYNTVRDERIVPVVAPEISVRVPTTDGAQNGVATFGTEQFSPGNLLEQEILEISNSYSQPFGAHNVTVGGRFEHTSIFNNFAQRSYGVWAFASIDSLETGTPYSYSFGYSNGGPIPADFDVAQYSLFAQDVWTVSDRLSVTFGVRADVPQFLDSPVYNQAIYNEFVNDELPPVYTTAKPKSRVLWSPRVGFNWDPTGDRQNQVRGTVGIFTGPPPLILIGNSYANTGLGLVTLNCGPAVVPAFTPVVADLPRACAGQEEPANGQAGTAGINVTDPDFRFPQNVTASLGFDRQLPAGFIFTFEGLYRKAINGVLIRDLNLKGPRMVGGEIYRDRNGRVLYADTISSSGSVTNSGQRVITSLGTPAVNFTEGVIQVTNQSRDFSYSLSPQIRRQFGEALDLRAGYTYLRAKDVQSLTSDRAISNWRNGAQYAGLETDLPLRTSAFERRHRITASGTWTAPWRGWGTEVSFYYNGSSGFPIVYVHNGDLNGDGYNGNDPIYIPTDATDTDEIRFQDITGDNPVSATQQAEAFEAFISAHECLDEQRGQIMKANSCRTPWLNRVDISIRQSLPELRGQRLQIQLDVFNFGNWLGDRIGKPEWGQQENPVLSPTFPDQRVLELRGRTAGPLDESQPIFNFANAVRTRGAFARQQTVASNFYQAQLTIRYTF